MGDLGALSDGRGYVARVRASSRAAGCVGDPGAPTAAFLVSRIPFFSRRHFGTVGTIKVNTQWRKDGSGSRSRKGSRSVQGAKRADLRTRRVLAASVRSEGLENTDENTIPPRTPGRAAAHHDELQVMSECCPGR